MSGNIRLAADIGGTFTDVVLDMGEVRFSQKVLTTPQSPERGLITGLENVLKLAGIAFQDVDVFVHGTTLATNAIIERRGARTGLILTQGFKDVLSIATEGRFDQYDLMIEKPVPLVSAAATYTLPERIDIEGCVHLALDESEVAPLARLLVADGVESVAICFLQSYINPVHEQRVAELLARELPDLSITLSHEVCPEIREYERASTAAANAYVQPLIDGYLKRTLVELDQRGFRGTMYMMTSGGGLTSVDAARRYPVRLVESGPAGGAIFAAQIAQRAREPRVLSFDMGGTTAKICLIEDGTPATARTFEVDRTARFMRGSGLPLRIPVIEMVEIGAGGGSIARVDALNRVVVGPESAASEPGPACYGRGGAKPAVTDADLVLGLIDPDDFAGGKMTLDVEAARKALQSGIGDKLGVDASMAAYAVYEMVCENMASAARVHAAETGFVTDRSTMIAFGGAAPLHAARVAEKVGIDRIIIPPNAGVGSAVGFLSAPVAFEIVRSRISRLDGDFDSSAVAGMLREISREARGIVERGALGRPVTVIRVGYIRYVGQGHEIAVELPHDFDMSADPRALREKFETEYRRLFGRTNDSAEVEIVNWSVTATTDPGVAAPQGAAAEARSVSDAVGIRSCFDGQTGQAIDVPVYPRFGLDMNQRVAGPAIIIETETSTFVSPKFDAYVDRDGSIVLERKAVLQ